METILRESQNHFITALLSEVLYFFPLPAPVKENTNDS